MALKPFFVIPTPLETVTSGNELANRPASHLGEFFYRGMVWESSENTNLWVKVDFGSSVPIDFVSLMNANAQPGTTIRIRLGDNQSEVDGTADYDTGALTFIDPAITRSDGRYHSHHELPSVQTKRWMRIDIGGHSNSFSAAMLVAGKKIPTSRYYDMQWNRDIRDLGSLTFARNGVPGVNPGERLRAISFRLAWLTEAEMEETFSAVDEATGKTEPFYCCFDPEASTYRQRRTFFGFNEEQPSFIKRGHNRHERNYQMLSLF